MRPRIEAEREMALFQAVLAAGGRMMEDNQQQAHLAELREAARGPEPERRSKRKPTAAFMAAAGIQVGRG